LVPTRQSPSRSPPARLVVVDALAQAKDAVELIFGKPGASWQLKVGTRSVAVLLENRASSLAVTRERHHAPRGYAAIMIRVVLLLIGSIGGSKDQS
jgi:hypothetical protein